MRSRLAAGLGLALLVIAAPVAQRAPAPAGRPPAAARPRVEAGVPFKVGETLTYDVSWSLLVVAGTATTTVQEKRQAGNSTVYSMVAEGRPLPLVAKLYPLYYRMDTLLDSYTLLSHRGSFHAEESKRQRTATTHFDRPRNRASFEVKADATTVTEYAVPPRVQDGIAAFYLLRARGVSPGERFTIPIADSGTIFTAQFEVGEVEPVKVPFGTLPARNVRVNLTDAGGQLFWKNTQLWMSTDARRLPLKMQAELPIGHFVLALKDVR